MPSASTLSRQTTEPALRVAQVSITQLAPGCAELMDSRHAALWRHLHFRRPEQLLRGILARLGRGAGCFTAEPYTVDNVALMAPAGREWWPHMSGDVARPLPWAVIHSGVTLPETHDALRRIAHENRHRPAEAPAYEIGDPKWTR